MLKNSLILITIVVALLFYSPPVIFSYFREDFNSDFSNPESWDVSNGFGLSFNSNSMLLSQSSGNSFPYVRSKTPIISPDDLSVEFRFNFVDAGGFGNGFAITDVNPPPGTVMTYPAKFSQYSMFYVWQNYLNPYLHIVTSLCPTSTPQCGDGTARVIFQSSSVDLSSHVVKIVRSNDQYTVFLDGNNIWTSAPTTRVAQNVWFGHPEITGTTSTWSKQSIDYLQIGEQTTSFPHLSQKDTRWGSTEYDSASVWAGLDKSGIDRWGCALTSAAMMLQKYGVKDLDGNEMKPNWLNTWLKAQPDGYIGPGYINWLAIARYAKGKAEDGKSLEFLRSYDAASAELPAILGLTGHFVVAHGEDITNWKINDPNLSAGNTDLSKTTTIKSVNRYVLSSTDLSYMLLAAKPGIDITMRDSANNEITLNWVEEYLSDDVESGSPSPTLRTAMVPKPASGDYKIEIENEGGPTQLELYLYDKGGEVEKTSLDSPSGSITYLLQYDRDQVSESETSVADTTPPSSSFTLPSLTNNWDGEIAGTATDSASGVDKVELIIKDPSGLEQTVEANGTTNWSYTIPTLMDGAYYFQSKATDMEENVESLAEPHRLVRDTKPPAKPNYVLSHNFLQRIWINWRPVNSATKYRLYYGRTRDEMTNTIEVTSPQWLSGVVNPGNYFLGVKAIDGAGNESAMSKIVKIKVIRLPIWLR